MERHQLKREIEYFILNTSINKNQREKDSKILEADLLWDASRFWATIIYEGSSIQRKMTYPDFMNYKLLYESQNDVIVDSNKLFERFWLRNVLGFIEIPRGISSLCHTFEKILNAKDEFKFLDYLYSSSSEKKNDRIRVSSMLREYNLANDTHIVIDDIWQLNFLVIKDDIIDLTNFEYYYSPFLAYWNEFQFLRDLEKTYEENSCKGLEISKRNWDKIYNNFAQLYTIPSVDSFMTQDVIRPISDEAY